MCKSSSAASRPQPEPAKPGRDFGRVARRIAEWTTSGLATALVLLAGLTLGRQVLMWWGEEPALFQTARRGDARPADDLVRQLEFGALATSIQTRSVRGSRDDVLQVLRELCRPATRPESSTGPHADAAEQKLLASLAGKEPAESGDGWRIDEAPQGLPLVICSTHVERNSFRSKRTSAGNSRANPVLPAPLDLRIVAIGLATPGENDQWTAYAFRVDGRAAASDSHLKLPLPAGSNSVMTLRQPDGSVLTTFRGAGEPAAWEEHFRTRLPQDGWRIEGDPATAHGRWQAEFGKAGAKPLRAQVHFEYDGQGGLHGLSLVAPDSEP